MRKLTDREWAAIRRLFQREERILLCQYGEPGRMKSTWLENFKRQEPKGFEVVEAARKVIFRGKA